VRHDLQRVAVSAGETSGNPYRFLIKQIGALALGGLAAFAIYRTDYRKLAARGSSTAHMPRRWDWPPSPSCARPSTAPADGFLSE
jgi:hypothetical protein